MTAASPAARTMLDPKALMAIRNLELRARTVVEGFWHGIHRSPYHGFSVEFTEYRPYAQGYDPRYLDWRLYRTRLIGHRTGVFRQLRASWIGKQYGLQREIGSGVF